jgi:hypothetical protein
MHAPIDQWHVPCYYSGRSETAPIAAPEEATMTIDDQIAQLIDEAYAAILDELIAQG